MKKLIIAGILGLLPALGLASGGAHLESANIDLKDQASLQRGAKAYIANCMGCHSLRYMRYNRMAEDLGINEADLRKDFILGDAKPGDQMTIAMRPEDGEKWFGVAVPDLTLVTRWRSPDWLYSYLKGFYVDPTRPYGVNNVVFPAVGMPHVLQGLQGIQEPVMGEKHGDAPAAVTGVKLVQPGTLSAEQYDGLVRDLTNFLTYVGEPMKLERQRLGWYVLAFLAFFFVVAYALKKEYWKDVH
ncbi:MAG TPA: cytochrome c1 [Chromatiaceae bacterium]|nr:cytochrome c1 [Chromatiaceae bacterium]